MDSEIYLDLNTFFHRLDPRTKITLLLAAFVIILYFQDPLWVLPIGLLILAQGYFSKSLKNLNRIRVLMIILAVSSVVMWTIFSSGKTTLFWVFKVEALEYSLGRTIVMLSLITEGMIFLSTTRNEEFVNGMIKMGLPYRVGFAISTALRLVPTIVTSSLTIAQAQRSRGLDLDSGGIIERIKKYSPLLIPVFVSTIRNTNIFSMALEAKGFGAREDRTFYIDPHLTKADFVVLAFIAVLFVSLTGLKIAGFGNIAGLIKY
jgi:energy-coupling factor transport system permease protein